MRVSITIAFSDAGARREVRLLGFLLCLLALTALPAVAQDTSTNAALPGAAQTETNAAVVPFPYPPIETNQPAALPPLYAPPSLPAPKLGGTAQLARPSAVGLPVVPPLLRWGPLTVQTSWAYSLSYGNGLQAFPGERANTLVNELDPGVSFQWSRHWTLSYSPSLRFYSSRSLRDTFNNTVSLAGGTTYEDWVFGLSQSYASYSDPIIETGSQLDQDTYATALNATRQLGSQSSLELAINQNFRIVNNRIPSQSLADTRSWSTMDWYNYQFWPRFGAAIGLGLTYDNVEFSPDMVSEQLQGRITWILEQKLSFVLSGGGEDRQFLASGVPDLVSPIYAFSAVYSPFAYTTLTLAASHTVSPSFFQDEVVESTGLSATLHQRLLGKLLLDLTAGYGTSTYQASAVNPSAHVSSYDTTSFTARLTAAVLKRGAAAVFYSLSYNSSSSTFYNYTTTEVGFELSYRY